jgi:ABC-type glycerol-3-phosphate transport system substrate-binding protein
MTASLDVGGITATIAKTTKNREEAWAFVRFLDEKSRMATAELRVPVSLADAAAWVKDNFAAWPNSNAGAILEGIRLAKAQEPLLRHPQWQTISQEVLNPGWPAILAQAKGLTQFLREVKQPLQRIVDEHNRRWGR